MLARLEAFIVEQFVLVIIIGFVFGVLFQTIAATFNPYILHLIVIVMYLAFLKLDFVFLKNEAKRWPLQLYLCITTLIIGPLIIFYCTEIISKLLGLDQNIAIGALILFASPTAVLAATLTMILKGNFEKSMLNMVITSLLAPITLPLMLNFFSSNPVSFSYMQLAKTLLILIIVPFALAMLTRGISRKWTQTLTSHNAAASVVLLTCVEIGSLHGFRNIIYGDFPYIAKLMLLSFILLLIAFVLGWVIEFRRSPLEKLTNALLMTWANLGLAIGIANIFYRKEAQTIVVFLTVMVLPWHISIVLAKKVANKIQKKKLPATAA